MPLSLSLRSFLIFVLSCVLTTTVFAQFTADYWRFESLALDFSDGDPEVINGTSNIESRSTSSISDDDGQLLFYASGEQVYTRNHTPMPGGNFSILAPSVNFEQTIIVPYPGRAGRFLLFNRVSSGQPNNPSGVYAVEVNTGADGGLGTVVENSMFTIGTDISFDELTAVEQTSTGDYWLLLRRRNATEFHAYRIDQAGIANEPVVTTVNRPDNESFADGQLKFSPDANWVASGYSGGGVNGFMLFNFDVSTGMLSNEQAFSLPTSNRDAEGVAFSSDATKVYVYQSGSTGEEGLYQYDLSLPLDRISDSQIEVGQSNLAGGTYMQLGPDGRIYMCKGGGSIGGIEYFGVIEYPNERGETCGFEELGLYLNGYDIGGAARRRPPSIVQSFYYRTSINHDTACTGRVMRFFPGNNHLITTSVWNFGDGSPTTETLRPEHTFASAGTYTVQLVVGNVLGLDTITKEVTVRQHTPLDLGEDRDICAEDKIGLELAEDRYTDFLWNTGDTTRRIKIASSATYSLSAIDTAGCPTSDSVLLNVNPLPELTLPDTIGISEEGTQINPGIYALYQWSTGDTTATLTINTNGWYSVLVEDSEGCSTDQTFLAYLGSVPPDNPTTSTGWRQINPQPTSSPGQQIYFLDQETGFILTSDELLVTRSGGEEWNTLLDVDDGRVLKFRDRTGYLLQRRSLLKSTYDGRGWNELSFFGEEMVSFSLLGIDTIVAVSKTSVHTSIDDGRNWTKISLGGINPATVEFTSLSRGSAVTTEGNLYTTEDGGEIWMPKADAPFGNRDEAHRIVFFNDQLGFATRGRWGYYRTVDGGRNWEAFDNGTTRLYNFQFINASHGYAVGEGGAFFYTEDGGLTWLTYSGSRFSASSLYGLYFFADGTGYAAGQRGRILKTVDEGQNWEDYAVTYLEIKNAHFINVDTGYIVAENRLFKTLDGGESWGVLDPILADEETIGFQFFGDDTGYATIDRSNSDFRSGKRFYRTRNGGMDWSEVVVGSGGNIEIRCFDFLNPQVGYLSIRSGQGARTLDGGQTWTEFIAPVFDKVKLINDTLYFGLGVNNSVYRSIDAGQNWVVVLEPDSGDLTGISFLSAQRGYVVGGSGNTFLTNDGGESWSDIPLEYEDYFDVAFLTPMIGYVLEEGGQIWRTNDAGYSWERELRQYGLQDFHLIGVNAFAYGENGNLWTSTADVSESLTARNMSPQEITDTSAIFPVQFVTDYDSTRVVLEVSRMSGAGVVFSFDTTVYSFDDFEKSFFFSDLLSGTNYEVSIQIYGDEGQELLNRSHQFTTTGIATSTVELPEGKAFFTPIPTSGPLYYQLNSNSSSTPYQIVNSIGQQVGKGTLAAYGSLDITHLLSGTYYIRVGENQSEIITYKVIKQ